MILDTSTYKAIEEHVAEWETAGSVQGGATKSVGKLLKELVTLLKMSDEMALDEITAILIFVIRTINKGQEHVLELCELLYDQYEFDDYCMNSKPRPGVGETGMINPDGSYVTLKELGIDD